MSEEKNSAANVLPAPAPAKKRRRFQLGLREGIIYMVILSVAFGLLGRAVDRMRRQERVATYLQSHGFRIDYHEPTGLTRLAFGKSYEEWPRWQRHMFLEVEGASQTSRFLTPANEKEEEELWRCLDELPALETLLVHEPFSTGLQLDRMPSRRRLKWLFWQSPLTGADIEQVSRCSELLGLDIRVEPRAATALHQLAHLEKLQRFATTAAPVEAVEAWSHWNRLQVLIVRDAGQAPGEVWRKLLANNPSLVRLGLYGCTSTSQACAGLTDHQHLVILDLSGSDADDEAVSLLRGLPRLAHIHLDRTRVTGTGFAPVTPRDWKALEVIKLSRANVDAAGIQALALLNDIHELDLSHNSLDDPVFVNLPARLPFYIVDISDNDVTDAGVEALAIGGVRRIYARRTFATEMFARRAQRRWPARGQFVEVWPSKEPDPKIVPTSAPSL